MEAHMYPPATTEITGKRAELAPEIHNAFKSFSARVFADGALPEKTKQLSGVALAHDRVSACLKSSEWVSRFALQLTRKLPISRLISFSSNRAGKSPVHLGFGAYFPKRLFEHPASVKWYEARAIGRYISEYALMFFRLRSIVHEQEGFRCHTTTTSSSAAG
jgi:hypothetical protein